VILDGCIERARTGLLEGEDAFHELFLANGDGRFFFRTVADPDPETVSQVPIHPTSINLLMEAVRRLDEVASLRDALPDADKAYVTQTHELDWNEERTRPLADKVFALLQTPRKLVPVARRIPASTHAVLQVAVELYETEQIR
jgi:hypothetical protein